MAISCGVGRRLSSNSKLLWLWCRLAATAPIRPLAWELPFTMGMALKKQQKNPVLMELTFCAKSGVFMTHAKEEKQERRIGNM